MNLCESNKAISKEVSAFILNVPDVKEESITDYLVWKWGELDKRLRFINVRTFNRQEENLTTGADFELELWLVGRKFNFPLLFQAKKFLKSSDSYVAKLNYPKKTQSQLLTLINYAKAKKRLPFYMYYSSTDKSTRSMCGGLDANEDYSLFISDAFSVKEIADGKYGAKVSKNFLLARSNPLHCIFCCPLSKDGAYFRHYFSSLYTELGYEEFSKEPLPDYVTYLLSDKFSGKDDEEILSLIKKNEIGHIRNIAVYDMRES